MKAKVFLFLLLGSFSLFAGGKTEVVHQTVDYVDLEQFSGDWYVIALIPTAFEKKAVNGVENYTLNPDGTIRVRYTFRKGSVQGKEKTMFQKGWVYNSETNAEWRVRPLWPLKLPYYILDLAEDYSYTIIGTDNYDYLWIMAREPIMDKSLLENLIEKMVEIGYEKDKILYMTQSWGEAQ